ncbi:NUDIX hydrolase [Pseudochrobactrum sp. MP213Fo]|uniref:NUDIX hydrolase n=1 Tax=Pseudochrobactrum sp. MP213Fo TaxID=3022250 RepID=UPI003B9EC295
MSSVPPKVKLQTLHKSDDAAAAPSGSATSSAYIRPRDAASLIIIDRSVSEPRILMGRRNRAMHFMPDKFVFPGGGTDAQDGKIIAANQLRPQDEAKLLAGMGSRANTRRARALAMTAIRETYEETGLLLGTPALPAEPVRPKRPDQQTPDSFTHPWHGFAQSNQLPDLSRLRYVARAVTPTGFVRRYDARFFASFLDEISPIDGTGHINTESSLYNEPELTDLQFVSFAEAFNLNIADITRIILQDIQKLLLKDMSLSSIYPVPLYHKRHGRHVREVI